MSRSDLLLDVIDLKTQFFTDDGIVRAVDGVSFQMQRGETLCIVGESGCGKTITARSILQILDYPGRVVDGQIFFHRIRRVNDVETREIIDLATLKTRGPEIRDVRGKDISMIFQEPMTSLSPIHTIGNQIIEAIRLHLPISKSEARERAIELLRRVGIPQPAERLDTYTFQLSGGMRQRAMIAMALSCSPSLLIADEPTTALDVTTQAQILDLMKELKNEMGMSIMLITHDLGVVAEMADNVVVMYLGTVAEQGNVVEVFHDPRHPYTQALLRSIPKYGLRAAGKRLDSIQGMVPDPYSRPAGCPYHPRCDRMIPDKCDRIAPPTIQIGENRVVSCLLYDVQGAAAQQQRNPTRMI
ncbi:MAG TPA: ABC transporter ATP-binding protein [Anaerolineae bacterium]|nr:ABC transporter ATP-binding protein [Anaerolineae bacterium]HQI82944.1 ABC transporter ATP-binding protein [Anaerolineae bacterium]